MNKMCAIMAFIAATSVCLHAADDTKVSDLINEMVAYEERSKDLVVLDQSNAAKIRANMFALIQQLLKSYGVCVKMLSC